MIVANGSSETAAPFEGLFGDTSELRVLEKLLALRSFTLNQKEVAERVDISRQSAAKVLEKFLKWGIVIGDSKGNQVLYRLNEGSPICYAADVLNGSLIERISGKEVLDRAPVIDLAKMSKDYQVLAVVKKPGAKPLVATAA